MIPFRLIYQPGVPVHEQATFAAKKAIISRQIRPGELFPSVRALSKALKINPNTAHKVVTQLIHEGLLEARPGIGTIVAERLSSTRAERGRLLGGELERLVVESKKMGLTLNDVQSAVAEHWNSLSEKASLKEAALP